MPSETPNTTLLQRKHRKTRRQYRLLRKTCASRKQRNMYMSSAIPRAAWTTSPPAASFSIPHGVRGPSSLYPTMQGTYIPAGDTANVVQPPSKCSPKVRRHSLEITRTSVVSTDPSRRELSKDTKFQCHVRHSFSEKNRVARQELPGFLEKIEVGNWSSPGLVCPENYLPTVELNDDEPPRSVVACSPCPKYYLQIHYRPLAI